MKTYRRWEERADRFVGGVGHLVHLGQSENGMQKFAGKKSVSALGR